MPSVAARAAASSIASGMPSRRLQTAAIIAVMRWSGAKRGSAACALSRNSRAVLQEITLVFGILRWDGERRNHVNLLSLTPQRLTAGGDDAHG